MNRITKHSAAATILWAGLALTLAQITFGEPSSEGRTIGKSPLDQATVYQSSISKDVAVRIRPFSTDNADLGTGAKKNKPKYRQIAEEMKENAPGLLLDGLTERLAEQGFSDVGPLDESQPIPAECYLIEGEFTVLNPGSQAKRYWAGFGAGKSRVCATGRVVDGQGELLMEFDHCRHEAMGLFGGESEGQMVKDSYATGAHLAEFMARWAQGDYAN